MLRAARAYVEHGQGGRGGQAASSRPATPTHAAAAAAALSPQELSRLDVRELRALLCADPSGRRSIGTLAALLHLARACEASAERGLAERVARSRRPRSAERDPALRREVTAERARDLVRDGAGRSRRATSRNGCSTEAGADELQTRVRASACARSHAWRGAGTPKGLQQPSRCSKRRRLSTGGSASSHGSSARAACAARTTSDTLGGRFDEAVAGSRASARGAAGPFAV